MSTYRRCGNAAHIKNVPGRKIDVNDAMWMLIWWPSARSGRASFPEQELQELRSYMRARKQFVRERTSISADSEDA
jgi:transposase